MRKLNDKQKEMITKQYGRVGFIVVMNTEKFGDEKNNLQEDINFGYNVMIEQGE